MLSSASGSTVFNSRWNSRRAVVGASVGRLRQTRTMLDASALVPMPMERESRSVRMGQVPESSNPDLRTAAKKVSQPVEDVAESASVPDCLKA